MTDSSSIPPDEQVVSERLTRGCAVSTGVVGIAAIGLTADGLLWHGSGPVAIYAFVLLAECVYITKALIHSWRTRRDVGAAMAAVFLFTLLNFVLAILRYGFPAY